MRLGPLHTRKARATEPGANVGRCRVIELQPTSYVDAVRNLHLDDNNYLNPKGDRLDRARVFQLEATIPVPR